MKEIVVSRNIVPLGQFKAEASRCLKELAVDGGPLVITLNGKPAAVLLSPVEYDQLRERHRFLESVAAGIDDAEAGRVLDTETLRRRLAERRAARGD